MLNARSIVYYYSMYIYTHTPPSSQEESLVLAGLNLCTLYWIGVYIYNLQFADQDIIHNRVLSRKNFLGGKLSERTQVIRKLTTIIIPQLQD